MMKFLFSLATALSLSGFATPLFAAAPTNDNLASRITLNTALPINVSGNNYEATREPEEPQHGGSYYSNSVWWNWTAPENRQVDISTTGFDYYNVIAVYESLPEEYPSDPEIVIDNTDTAAVTVTGSWTASSAGSGYLGADYLDDGNSGQGTKSVRFAPAIAGLGDYDVYIRYPAGPGRATTVPVEVKHTAGTSTFTINERLNGGTWVKLNAFGPLTLNANATVTVRNTGVTDGNVAADAVRFVRRAAPSFGTLRLVRESSSYYGNVVSFQARAGRSYQIAVTSYFAENFFNLAIQTSTRATITSPVYATAIVDQPFNYQITASQNPTYYYAYGLPSGVTLNSQTGLITGSSSSAGEYYARVGASTGGGYTEAPLFIRIDTLQPRITSPTSAPGMQGAAFNYQVTATKSPTSYSARFMPTGLSLDSDTGLVTGTPAYSGEFLVDFSATNGDGVGQWKQVRFVIQSGAPVVTGEVLELQLGANFTYQIAATQNPTSYSASGLPDGLTIDTATGVISGQIKAAGYTDVYLGATNIYGNGDAYLTLKVFSPTADNFADRIPVSGANFSLFINNTGATLEEGEPLHQGVEGGASVWYTWKAPATGAYRVTLDSSFAGLVGIYEGTKLSSLRSAVPAPFAGGYQAAPFIFNAVAGHRYQIAIDAAGGETGEAFLTMEKLAANAAKLLEVSIDGHGSVTNGFLGTSFRKLGVVYTIEAKPAPGYIFSYWTGNIEASTPKITFSMQEDTELQAVFIPNPIAGAKGTYVGLLATGDEGARVGRIKLKVGATGAFTASFIFGGKNYSLSGVIDSEGQFTGTIPRGGLWPLSVTFSLDLGNPENPLFGEVSDDLTSASFGASRTTHDATDNPAPQLGRYTWHLTGPGSGADSPAGTGYGTLISDKSGNVRAVGMLPDGTPISTGGVIADNGQCALHLVLYGGRGFISGTVAFVADEVGDFSGTLSWRRAPQRGLYPDGFDVETTALGSRYAVPFPGNRVIDFGNEEQVATVLLDENSYLGAFFSQTVVLTPANRLVSLEDRRFAMSITPGNGLFTGRIFNPVTNRMMPFGGAVLQKANTAAGLQKMRPYAAPVAVRY